MTETLVSLQIHFATVDRAAVAEQIGPAVEAAIAAAGTLVTISVQGYDPDEEQP